MRKGADLGLGVGGQWSLASFPPSMSSHGRGEGNNSATNPNTNRAAGCNDALAWTGSLGGVREGLPLHARLGARLHRSPGASRHPVLQRSRPPPGSLPEPGSATSGRTPPTPTRPSSPDGLVPAQHRIRPRHYTAALHAQVRVRRSSPSATAGGVHVRACREQLADDLVGSTGLSRAGPGRRRGPSDSVSTGSCQRRLPMGSDRNLGLG